MEAVRPQLSSRLEVISLQLEKDKIHLSKEEKKHTDELVKSIKALTKRMSDTEKANKSSPMQRWFADKKNSVKQFTTLGGLTQLAASKTGPGLMGAVLSTFSESLEKKAEARDKRFGFVSSVLKGTDVGRNLEKTVGTKEAIKRIQGIYQERMKNEIELSKLNEKRKEIVETGKEAGITTDVTKEELERIKELEKVIEKLNEAVTGIKKPEVKEKLTKEEEKAKRDYKKSVIMGIRKEMDDLPRAEKMRRKAENPNYVRDLENQFTRDIDSLDRQQLKSLLEGETESAPEKKVVEPKFEDTIKTVSEKSKEPIKPAPPIKPEVLTKEEQTTKDEFIQGIIEGIQEGIKNLKPEEREALQKQNPEFMKGIEEGVLGELEKLSKSQLQELMKISKSLEKNGLLSTEDKLEDKIKKSEAIDKKETKEKKGAFASLMESGLNLFKGGLSSIGSMFGSIGKMIMPVIAGIGTALAPLLGGLAGIAVPAAAVAGVGALAYGAGTLLNDNVLNPLAEKATGTKGATVGTAIYDGVDKLKSWAGLSSDADITKPTVIKPQLDPKVKKAAPLKIESAVDTSSRTRVTSSIESGVNEKERKDVKQSTSTPTVVNSPTVVSTTNNSNTVQNFKPKLRNDECSYLKNLECNFRY